MSAKLLIDPKRQKVLFAEAEKDVVDFLFSLLTLPLGTVISLISESGMVGCLGKLHESVESLGNKYLESKLNKNILLNPMSGGADLHHLLTDGQATEEESSKAIDDKSSIIGKFYICLSCFNLQHIYNSQNRNNKRPWQYYVGDHPAAVCPQCNRIMYTPATCIASPPNAKKSRYEEGFVKDAVTYMIMDDLEVKPMSAISSIDVLNKFKIKDVGSLKEKVVHLGMEEGVKVLTESLQSKSVLTNVFLGKKAAA